MTLSVGAAFEVLQNSQGIQPTDPRLEDRLAQVQLLLAEDLEWVEATVASVASRGLVPATEAATHLVTRGGKRVRPLVTLLSSACFGAIPESARHLATVSELIHSSTLLHDDVIDEGTVRRGASAPRLLWGNAVSVLAGDLLLVHSLERTLTYAPQLMPQLIDTLRELVNGEVLQLRGRRALDFSEATYEQILKGKTASLFAFCTRGGARLAGAPPPAEEALAEFGRCIGMAFQLVDDVLDYVGEGTGKTLVADLTEGKLTLPLVLASAADPRLPELVRAIHAGQASHLAEVRQRVRDSGACQLVRARAEEFTGRAKKALEHVPGSPARCLLDEVGGELVARVR